MSCAPGIRRGWSDGRPPRVRVLRRRLEPGPPPYGAALLERLTSALGLEPVGERGEYLKLLPEDLGEFELRGRPGAAPSEGHRGLHCVMRPGWLLGDHIVVRPLVEPASER